MVFGFIVKQCFIFGVKMIDQSDGLVATLLEQRSLISGFLYNKEMPLVKD